MRRWIGLAAALGLVALAASQTLAAELVMFEERGCPWCRRWHEEVGPGYPKSAEGRRAPLRVVDMHSARPADLAHVPRVTVSPTFVLVDGGTEVGRITGYPGADFFWGLLAELAARLPGAAPQSTPSPVPRATGASQCPGGRAPRGGEAAQC
jgi:hypothetical protein